MSSLIEELRKTGIYKRSQGRITRQVTFAAIFVGVAVGLWRLSDAMSDVDPWRDAEPAQVVYVGPHGAVTDSAVIKVTGEKGTAEVEVSRGMTMDRLQLAIDAHRSETGVAAKLEGSKLTLKSVNADNPQNELTGASALVQVTVVSGSFPVEGVDADGKAFGRNSVDFGLRYAIPSLLLILGTWIAYRMVNYPVFADFLIAVEAEMNKVSWPTRQELFRASIVVLVTIFALAAVLLMFDSFWQTVFHAIRVICARQWVRGREGRTQGVPA